MTMKKLGVPTTDKVTGLEGVLTHAMVDSAKQVNYLFQPTKLTEAGTTMELFRVTAARVPDAEEEEGVDIPVEILMSEVRDKHTGFNGICVGITLHLYGCIHLFIQSKELRKGEVPPPQDFNILSCEGEAIKALSEVEVKKEVAVRPSPSPTGSHIP